MKHAVSSINAARARIADAVKIAEHKSDIRVHVGTANIKTNAINEGTSPLVTCSALACATCAKECYAIWHIDNVYKAARRNHAENTIMRRRDAVSYYDVFFSACRTNCVNVLRVNETGDFETVEQLKALYSIARRAENAHITVIGYTRRRELLPLLDQAPARVHIRYSLYRDGDVDGDTIRAARCACVSDSETTCPAQIAAKNRKRWTCAECARHCAGCASSKAVVIFKAH